LGNAIPYLASVQCDEMAYYRVEVTDPCSDLVINLHNIFGQSIFYVSNYPTRNPNWENQMWTSYYHADEDILISHWDYDFVADLYYIGVYSSCASNLTTASYNITATITLSTDNIVGIPITNQSLLANDYRFHRFCVSDPNSDITVTLINNLTISEPEMLVSTMNDLPLLHSYTWKLAQIARRYIYISHNDANFRTGHYYVSIFGWCTPVEDCGVPEDQCTSSCTRVPDDSYTLIVQVSNGTAEIPIASSNVITTTSPIIPASSYDTPFINSGSSSDTDSWKRVAIAALVFGVLSFVGMVVFAVLLTMRFRATRDLLL